MRMACATTVCVTWKSSVRRARGMSAVKEPSIHSSCSLSLPVEKGTISPAASFARSETGRITVGRQHEACTAEVVRLARAELAAGCDDGAANGLLPVMGAEDFSYFMMPEHGGKPGSVGHLYAFGNTEESFRVDILGCRRRGLHAGEPGAQPLLLLRQPPPRPCAAHGPVGPHGGRSGGLVPLCEPLVPLVQRAGRFLRAQAGRNRHRRGIGDSRFRRWPGLRARRPVAGEGHQVVE